ncbi:HD domain-containing protein [Candidatus Bathyarchaeota archaeon]|nr:HD domain-containing protein [Candidatus Bathyarchaeota archaeon]
MDKLPKSNLQSIIKFLEIVGILKRTKRSGWINVGIYQPESVADHTFRTAFLCMIYADLYSMNPLKLLRMALIHDLPEAITGDLMPSQKTKKTRENEKKSVLKILNILPLEQRENYLVDWKEYQEGKTKEAKAVHQLDKIEMALQAKEYEKLGLTNNSMKRFIKSAQENITWPEMKRFLLLISEEKEK